MTVPQAVAFVVALVFLFVFGPIAMHIWGSMFAKGFFSKLSKYFNKTKNKKQNTNGKEDQ
jgi:hypothetical protein